MAIVSATWTRMSVYTTEFEIEAADKRSLTKVPRKVLKEKMDSLLRAQLEGHEEVANLVSTMIRKGRVKMLYDCHTSPTFGDKTKRVTLVMTRHSVFPNGDKYPAGEFIISAPDKRSEIEEIRIRASVSLKIVIAKMPKDDVQKALVENPSWFCGEV